MDDKILNFDITKGYEAFVCMFTDEEVESMCWYLDHECGVDYYYTDNHNVDKKYYNDIIIDYVREWLCSNIRNDVRYGSQKLFDIVYKVFG